MEQQLVHLEDPVINLLYRRLSDMLKDNMLDAAESAELLELLQQFTGKPRCSDNPFSSPTSLPLDNPEPTLEWTGRMFLFTGTMAYGPRKACEALVVERGVQSPRGEQEDPLPGHWQYWQRAVAAQQLWHEDQESRGNQGSGCEHCDHKRGALAACGVWLMAMMAFTASERIDTPRYARVCQPIPPLQRSARPRLDRRGDIQRP